jgi:hypothetical protein
MRYLGLIPILSLIAGCIPLSLNPIYTSEDLVFDAGLLGTWAVDSGTWTFEQIGDNTYKLTIQDADTKRPVVLSAHLVQIKSHRLLDLSIADDSELPELEDMELLHLLPAHSFWYVKREGDSLSLRTFSRDWLKKRIVKGRLWVEHVEVDDRLVFTAKTERMQRFLAKWGNSDSALGDWETITRQ